MATLIERLRDGAGKARDIVEGYLENNRFVDAGGNISGDPTPQPPAYDPEAEYRRMQQELADAQRRNRIARLDTAKNNALSALDTEQASVQPHYYNKRNESAGRSEVGAMNFANYMAARGIKGAAGAMPEIYRQAGLQGQMGALDQAEARDMSTIDRQRGLINTNYASDVAGANADIDSQTMQNSIDQWRRDQDRRDRQDEQNRDFLLKGQQMDASNTGYYNPWAAKYALDDEKRNQLAPYMGNLQKFIDENPDSDLIPYAQNARYQKIMGSPELMQQYGDRYRTVDSMSAALRNKSQEIENAMNQIKLSSLPETMKLEAEGLRQEVAAGRYDADTALAQLNQIKSQTRATNALADKRLSGDSGSNSSNKIAEKNADTGSLYSYYQNELPVNFQNRGKGIDDYLAYLQNSNVAPKIISDIGSANYAKLITWARAQVAQAQEAADEYGF